MLTAFGYLMLVGMAAGMLYSFSRPPFAFVLVVCLYPLKQLQMTYMGFFAQNSSYFNFLVFACVAAGVLGNLTRNRAAMGGFLNKANVLLLLLYVYVLMGVAWTPVADNAWARIRDGAPYWAMQVLLLPFLFSSLDDVRKTFVPAMLVGLLSCVLFFTNPNASFYAGRLTLNIPLAGMEYRGNPLATAQLGGHIAIIAALMLPLRAGWLLNGVRMAALFMGLGMAVAAGSRGQLAAAVLSILLFYPLARRVANIRQFFLTATGVAVFGLVGIIAIKFFLGQDAEQLGRWNITEWGKQTGERSADAFHLIEAWWANPGAWALGLGTNYFSFLRGEPMSYAHNVLLELIGENGLVGITMYLVVAWLVFTSARDLWRMFSEDPAGRATLACLFAQAIFLTILSYKQGTFVGLPEPYYIWVLITKLAVTERVRQSEWMQQREWDAYAQGLPA